MMVLGGSRGLGVLGMHRGIDQLPRTAIKPLNPAVVPAALDASHIINPFSGLLSNKAGGQTCGTPVFGFVEKALIGIVVVCTPSCC